MANRQPQQIFENPFLWPVVAFGYPFGTPALSKIGRVTSVFIEAVLNTFLNISEQIKDFVLKKNRSVPAESTDLILRTPRYGETIPL
jgi:hypothetical protein